MLIVNFTHSRRRRAAGGRDSRLSQPEKFFPGTAILFQPELHQSHNSKPIANFNYTLSDAGPLIHGLVSLKNISRALSDLLSLNCI